MEPLDQPNPTQSPPPFVSFMLYLILGALVGALVGGGVAVGIGMAMGFDISTMTNPGENNLSVRTFLRLSNLFSHLFTFTLPALLLVILFYKRRTLSFLQLDKWPSGVFIAMGILWVFVSFPFAQLLYWLNRQLPLPDSLLTMEESATRLLETLMTMNSPWELLLNIIVVGVVPAIGEELLFRGIIQRRLQQLISPIAAIWITAVLFSAIHLQFAGFFPRLLLGALLGYLFYWSRSLWLPIIAHFFFNAAQVTAQYFYGDQMEQLNLEGPAEPTWIGGIVSLVMMLGLGYLMYQNRSTDSQVSGGEN